MLDAVPNPSADPSDAKSSRLPADDAQEGYGPTRRKVTGKPGGFTLHRPARMSQDDFTEMMQEVVPRLIKVLDPLSPPENVTESNVSPGSSTDRPSQGTKRDAESRSPSNDPPQKTTRTESPHATPEKDDEDLLVTPQSDATFAKDQVAILSVEHLPCSPYVTESLNQDETRETAQLWNEGESEKCS